jgi:hypothetical protein
MFNPWTGLPTRAAQQQQTQFAPWQPRWRAPTAGILGPRPSHQAYTATGQQQQSFMTPTWNNGPMESAESAGWAST